MNEPSMYQLTYIVAWLESVLDNSIIESEEQTREMYNVTRYNFTATQLDRVCELVNAMIPAFYPDCNLRIFHLISTKTQDNLIVISTK